MLTVIIVDDEPRARRGITLLLQPHSDIEILGEASNVAEARELLKTCRPDIVFLDIDMPNEKGLALKDSISEGTWIVFTTAHAEYAEYAVDAFDLDACDYLLKPIRAQRLVISLDKVRRLKASEKAGLDRSIILHVDNREVVINIGDILALQSEGDYTRYLIFQKSSLLVSKTLGSCLECLPESFFLRVNRSLAVNLQRIDQVKYITRDYTLIDMQGMEDPIELKRVGTKKIKAVLTSDK